MKKDPPKKTKVVKAAKDAKASKAPSAPSITDLSTKPEIAALAAVQAPPVIAATPESGAKGFRKEVIVRHTRKIRWGVVGMVVVAGALLLLIGGDMVGYVQTWAGNNFKALNGGLLGWLVSRYVVGLDLSSTSLENRPMAGLAQAILIAGFAIAVS